MVTGIVFVREVLVGVVESLVDTGGDGGVRESPDVVHRGSERRGQLGLTALPGHGVFSVTHLPHVLAHGAVSAPRTPLGVLLVKLRVRRLEHHRRGHPRLGVVYTGTATICHVQTDVSAQFYLYSADVLEHFFIL